MVGQLLVQWAMWNDGQNSHSACTFRSHATHIHTQWTQSNSTHIQTHAVRAKQFRLFDLLCRWIFRFLISTFYVCLGVRTLRVRRMGRKVAGAKQWGGNGHTAFDTSPTRLIMKNKFQMPVACLQFRLAEAINNWRNGKIPVVIVGGRTKARN